MLLEKGISFHLDKPHNRRGGDSARHILSHFKSKHEIFQFVLDDLISKIRSQIRTIDLNIDESPAAQMRGNVERVVSAITSSPEVAQILFNEAVGLDKETQERLKISTPSL